MRARSPVRDQLVQGDGDGVAKLGKLVRADVDQHAQALRVLGRQLLETLLQSVRRTRAKAARQRPSNRLHCVKPSRAACHAPRGPSWSPPQRQRAQQRPNHTCESSTMPPCPQSPTALARPMGRPLYCMRPVVLFHTASCASCTPECSPTRTRRPLRRMQRNTATRGAYLTAQPPERDACVVGAARTRSGRLLRGPSALQ